MKRKLSLLIGILVSILLILSACGTKSGESTAKRNLDLGAAENAPAFEDKADSSGDVIEYDKEIKTTAAAGVEKNKSSVDNGTKPEAETGIIEAGVESSSLANAILDQRKIIRNANVSIIADNYEKTYGKIQSMIETSGIGYIQESRVYKQGSSGKSGMIIVRVDADRFSTILNNIKGLGEVIEAGESTEDVSDKFYDTESELRLLKYEQSRLEEYLKKISDPDIIFKTESRLTDIRHQIESLTVNLNKLSNMIKLSTITINITEKNVEEDTKKENSYIDKLFKGFSDSMKGIGNFIGQLVLLIVTLLPVLVLMAVVIIAAWFAYKKLKKSKNKSE